jgi:hypothetical protein
MFVFGSKIYNKSESLDKIQADISKFMLCGLTPQTCDPI